MKKAILAVALVLCASVASAATIHVTLQTDKAVYTQGETVKWTILAWGDADTAGIALLGVTLTESKSETMTAALTRGSGLLKSLRSSFTVTTQETIYDALNGFQLSSAGTSGAGGVLADILVSQPPPSPPDTYVTDIGNDGVQHIFAIGSFIANVAGTHTLTPSLTGDNYISATSGNAVQFETSSLNAATYTVNPLAVPEPATMGLVALGFAGVMGYIRRRK